MAWAIEQEAEMNDRDVYPKPVYDLLIAGGWYPGRNVSAPLFPKGDMLFARAKSILEEFGGLSVGKGGPGYNLAATTVDFCSAEEPPDVNETEDGRRFVTFGYSTNHHITLMIDVSGAVFSVFDDFDNPDFIASTVPIALIQLLLGIRTCRGCLELSGTRGFRDANANGGSHECER
jgi:hypothetical protein